MNLHIRSRYFLSWLQSTGRQRCAPSYNSHDSHTFPLTSVSPLKASIQVPDLSLTFRCFGDDDVMKCAF